MSFKDKILLIDMVDNGSGMSRDVMQNVYMKLGASTKGQGDDIGGFGRARILTCFSQDSYSIRSGDYQVKGQGATYDLMDAPPIKGCAVSIGMPENEVSGIYRGLARVLRQSSLRAAIEIKLDPSPPDYLYVPDILEHGFGEMDEKGWSRFRGWSRLGRHLQTLEDEKGPWADLYVNEGQAAQKHASIIRVNGMSMYDDHISIPSQVVVALVPGRAREILTASRDAIRGPFRVELQDLYQRLSSERLSGLRKKPAEPLTELRAPGDTRDQNGFLIPLSREQIEAVSARSFSSGSSAYRPGPLSQAEPDVDSGWNASVSENDGPAYPQGVGLMYPLAVHIADPTSAQRAASERHSGHSWLSPGSEGRSSELLHAAWTAACRHAIQALVEIHPNLLDQSRDRWVTGFVFDRDMAACHMRIGDIENGLLVNPVDQEGRLRFKLSDPASMKRLISEAIHEVSHIASRRHDEFFASVMTDLMGKIRDRDIERDMREEVDRMRSWQEARKSLLECLPEARDNPDHKSGLEL